MINLKETVYTQLLNQTKKIMYPSEVDATEKSIFWKLFMGTYVDVTSLTGDRISRFEYSHLFIPVSDLTSYYRLIKEGQHV